MVMAINFTDQQVQYGYLVLATADVQINLTGLGGYTIPVGAEVCLFWYRDSTAGAQAVRGTQATTMLITGYYLQDQDKNDKLIRANCTPVNAPGYLPKAFPSTTTNRFNVDEVMNWHNRALRSLINRACTAEGLPTMGNAAMTTDQLYKGSRFKGKQQTPEAYLAMAFKHGIRPGRTIHSGRHNEWTARNVYDYGLKAAGLA
jgi:hypothetical protein